MRISVLICTRNRSGQLTSCLNFLKNQTIKPYEIVVIDNNSDDDTQKICKKNSNSVPIRYFCEKKIGLSFARNKSIGVAKGDICAFVDDDCFADINWIHNIKVHFEKNKESVGVIGKSLNNNPNNIYSTVENAYSSRWLIQNISNLSQKSKITNGKIIDFKNAAFLTKFIKSFRFSTQIVFASDKHAGDEDVEIGCRLYCTNNNIHYDPNIIVRHNYSLSFHRLIQRNFWNGYSNWILTRIRKINFGDTPYKVSLIKFTTILFSFKKELDTFSFTKFIILCLFFPYSSKAGKLYAIISFILGKNRFIHAKLISIC